MPEVDQSNPNQPNTYFPYLTLKEPPDISTEDVIKQIKQRI